MQLSTKLLKDLTKAEYALIFRHNFSRGEVHGPSSGMRSALDWYAVDRRALEMRKPEVVFAYEGKKFLAWGLVDYQYYGMKLRPDVQVFVRPAYRRRGIGTEIMQFILKTHKSIIKTHPWDHRSAAFFRSLPCQTRIKS